MCVANCIPRDFLHITRGAKYFLIGTQSKNWRCGCKDDHLG